MNNKDLNNNKYNTIYPMWIKKYDDKAFKTKIIQTIITAITAILFVISLILLINSINKGDYSEYIWLCTTYILGIFLLAFIILTIAALIIIKPILFHIDGYYIIAYIGYFKDSLIIDGVTIDSIYVSSFHSNEIFAQLPNRKNIVLNFLKEVPPYMKLINFIQINNYQSTFLYNILNYLKSLF